MPLPSVVYATYVGIITQDMIGRAIFHLNGGIIGGVQEVHVLFQSLGGAVGDGIALFSYLSGCPIPIHLYNGGAVESAGVLAYLGAKHRHVSAHGTFLIHPTSFQSPTQMGAEAHRQRAKHMDIDNKRVSDILNTRTTVPARRYSRFDLVLTAQEAINFGIAQDIRDFIVPPGNQVFDLTQQRP